MPIRLLRILSLLLLSWSLLLSRPAQGEAILQYFNTSWAEITFKMPELAEAGYSALWLPPPTKGSGGLSVGYDLWDPFDLGDKNQRNTVRTRYGTKDELLLLIETAHRFGIRVYFDNIMNHRAFDIPGFNENTPIDLYPGMVPEDFHLRVTPDGFYRKWDNTRNWGDEWQVIHLGLADLIDIAQEPGPTNFNFGPTEGSTAQKIKYLRDPTRPDYYCYRPGNGSGSHSDGNGIYVGFGPGNGITAEFLQENRDFYSEFVQDYLNRAVRWLVNETKADGLRLDAVKHVRPDFFGATGAGANASNYGYTGEIQRQFNLTRGFSDWNNHRDSAFNDSLGRDDALIFGEHLGAPPGYGDFVARGMRLVDAPLHRELNNRLGNPWGSLSGLDAPGWSGDPNFNQFTGIAFPQSHDDDYSNRRELQHAFYLMRQGISNVYTDGYYKAEILGQSGGAFPRHANNPFLGQFGDIRLPNLLDAHEQFARGDQIPKYGDGDVLAFERRDKRENAGMSDADGTVMLFMMNDNFSSGQARPIQTTWPSVNLGANTYLYNYSSYEGGFYKWAHEIAAGSVDIPPGGYFIFSLKNPDPATPWNNAGGAPVTIFENGVQAKSLTYPRKDGPDGDAAFNPQNLLNRGYPIGVIPAPFTYLATVPRVTTTTNLRFLVTADGSAKNILLKLDGGVNVNSQMNLGPLTGDLRDHPPALSTDTFLGYEQMRFVRRLHPEKFAAVATSRNQFGSSGAETFRKIIGAGGFTIVNGPINANAGEPTNGGNSPARIEHNPTGQVGGIAPGEAQYSESGSNIRVWSKTNSVGEGFKMIFYYTTDGTNPEGAGGIGIGTTRVAAMGYQHGENGNDWWGSTTVPIPPGGAELRYKIGMFRDTVNGQPPASVMPENPAAVAYKTGMTTHFEIDGFNASSVLHFPHNDYGAVRTGLADGFHVLRGRAFLDRFGRASIYNTFTQPFYLDAERPQGTIVFPQNNGDTVGGQEYEAVLRTDATVREVWFQISDGAAINDDSATGILNGNGEGFEPYTDLNQNGTRDAGEPFEDIDGNGQWDADIGESWVKASAVTASPAITPAQPSHIKEWRFKYRNIPASGTATLRARLLELSSLPRSNWTPGLTDAAGLFTTLTRAVSTAGPDLRFYFGWPRQDGDQVGPDYIAKVYFSKSLAAGLNAQQIIDRFLIRLQSNESGSALDGQPLSRDNYSVIFDETTDLHALAFEVPNLFNGQPAWLHGIETTFTRPDQPILRATRLVTAFPVPPPPRIEIVSPIEVGSDGRPFEIILPETETPTAQDRQFIVRVATDASADTVSMAQNFSPDTFAGSLALRPPSASNPNPVIEGNGKFWDFIWSDLVPGQYRFTATVSQGSQINTARRNSRVVFRQLVKLDNSGDSDDDGIPDTLEGTQTPLPNTLADTWTNGQVHAWFFSGKTNPLSPTSDGGGLPDGLQLGLEGPIAPASTTLATDTNNDGYRNFIADLDPPRFNTFNNPGYQQTQARTNLLAGSVSDPSKPDDDEDGLLDATEDLNRNGRVDIALVTGGNITGAIVHPNVRTFPNTSRVDANALPSGSIFLETDPNNPDTDGDGLQDGQEDINANGRVDIFLLDELGNKTPLNYRLPVSATYNFGASLGQFDGSQHAPILSRAVHFAALLANYNPLGTGALQVGGWPKLLIEETDPLRSDTIGDGLPDGWKLRYGLDPLDDGVYNWRTGVAGNSRNGPSGDLTGDGITNLQHFQNGTDPRSVVNFTVPPGEAIVVGPGAQLGTINGVTYFEEFLGWTLDDLIVLDEYEGDGFNNQGGDLFPGGDGFDSSRDLVAFYARDGGDTAQGGDGKVYFRVDLQNLQAFAENGFLNLYIVVNSNPGLGERVLPDEVDTLTDMRWRTVIAVYDSANGRVFVDTNPSANTNNFGDNLFSGKGVVIYDATHPKGFKGAYFNSELDSIELAVSRDALRDGGWLGDDFGNLQFQVYTTRDGTSNSPQGAGDLGGRSDLRDTIYDDRVVEDNFFSQAGREDILKTWFAKGANAEKRAKVMLLVEGNQAILPGSQIQAALNDSAGAGWHRSFLAHEVFQTPLTLAITPTLASALQWARVDPAANKPWLDGPTFNTAINTLAQEGLIALTGTTFSGHVLPYTPTAFDTSNLNLANTFLTSIYGQPPSSAVLYAPERVLNSAVLDKIRTLGYTHTFIDQRQHLERWFGRDTALGNDGYRINRINDVNTFVITEDKSGLRFTNTDRGASLQLRQLLSRKARSGQQDQVVTLLSSMDDFKLKTNADAYDRVVRWISNRPWIEIVHPQDIIGDPAWGTVNRGTQNALPLEGKDFVQYASQGSYDNWFFGSATREGLAPKVFNIRTGVSLPEENGRIGSHGLADSAWNSLPTTFSSLDLLGRGTVFASQFVTAFHNQGLIDLRKFSTGEYINPASGYESLAGFSKNAQSQIRHAALYSRVAQWAQAAQNDAYFSESIATSADVDLDGENEYLLYNDRLFACFERIGGRLTQAFVRDVHTHAVQQVIGNPLSYSGSETEEEGASNLLGDAISAYRTSGFKDWFAAGPDTSSYVNQLYSAAPASSNIGWTFSSADSPTPKIVKTITLAPRSSQFTARYQLAGNVNKLFIRFGLSPHLLDLLIHGQSHLSPTLASPGEVNLINRSPAQPVRAFLRYTGSSLGGVTYNPNAVDDNPGGGIDFNTLTMRNQAQTQQVELETTATTATFTLGFESGDSITYDSDGDGLPDTWESAYNLDPNATLTPDGRNDDPDGDGRTNYEEYILGTNPRAAEAPPIALTVTSNAQNQATASFPTLRDRLYRIETKDDLTLIWNTITPDIPGTGATVNWIDPSSQFTPNRFYRLQIILSPNP